VLYERVHGRCRKLVGSEDERAWGRLDREEAKIGAGFKWEEIVAFNRRFLAR
jgi:hypothetical protein